MRYRGGGVGNMTTCQCNEVLLADKHTPFGENTDVPIPAPTGDQLSGTEDEGDDVANEGEGNVADEGESDAVDEGDEERNDELLAAATHDTQIIREAGFAAL